MKAETALFTICAAVCIIGAVAWIIGLAHGLKHAERLIKRQDQQEDTTQD